MAITVPTKRYKSTTQSSTNRDIVTAALALWEVKDHLQHEITGLNLSSFFYDRARRLIAKLEREAKRLGEELQPIPNPNAFLTLRSTQTIARQLGILKPLA